MLACPRSFLCLPFPPHAPAPSLSFQVRYLERRESVARRGFFGRAQLFHFQQLSGPPIFADMDAPGGFAAGSWLLTPPDPAAALAFLDLQHLTSFSYARSSGGEGDEGPMAFASVHDVRDEKAGGGEAGRVLVMELAQCPKRPEEGQGDRWAPIDLYRDGGRDRTFWLFDRVADRNVVKVGWPSGGEGRSGVRGGRGGGACVALWWGQLGCISIGNVCVLMIGASAGAECAE